MEAIREDTGDTLVFLLNHHGLGASTIVAIYKDRWQIELFLAESEDQDVRRHLGQRGEAPDLDSIDLDAPTTLPAAVFPV